jgi:hypothetical protein
MPNMSNTQDQLKTELKFCQNLTKFQNRPKNTQNENLNSFVKINPKSVPSTSNQSPNNILSSANTCTLNSENWPQTINLNSDNHQSLTVQTKQTKSPTPSIDTYYRSPTKVQHCGKVC